MGADKVVIRQAAVTDASAIAHIQITAWRHNMSAWVPVSFIERFNQDQQAAKYASRIQDPEATLFVAEKNDKVAGIIGSKPNPAEPYDYAQYIFGLYVDPLYQRQGVGYALLKKLLDEVAAKQAKNAVIFTFAANIPARFLYEKCGGVLLPYTDHTGLDLKIPHVSYGFHF